jgi:hypothetical protein
MSQKHKKNQKLALDIILGRVSPLSGLSTLKHDYSLNAIEDLLKQILNVKNKSNEFLLDGILPKSYDEIFTGNLLIYKSNCLEQELVWNSILFKKHSDVINKFLTLKDSFEINLLNGDYDSANNLLTLIENNICYSLWTLENRFLLEEYKNGLESNKEYLDFMNTKNNNPAVMWLADTYSYKAEKAISYHQYNGRMNKLVDFIADEEVKSYFRSKAFGINPYSINDLNDILFFENKSSIIDRYLTFIISCQVLCSSVLTGNTFSTIKKCLSIIGPSIKDRNILNLNMFFGIDTLTQEITVDLDMKMSIIAHKYTIGDYDYVIEYCNKLINEHSNCFEIYEFLVKSILHTNTDIIDKFNECLKKDIIDNMYSAYIKQDNSIEAYQNLRTYSRYFCNSGFGQGIFNYTFNRFGTGKIPELGIISALNCKFINPRFSISLGESETKLKYLNKYNNIFGNLAHTNLFTFFYSPKDYDFSNIDKIIPTNRIKWYQSLKYTNHEENDESLSYLSAYYEELKNHPSIINYYWQEKVLYQLFNLLINTNSYNTCLELFIDSYLNNKYMTIRLDYHKLYRLIFENLNNTLKANLSLSILTHLCCKGQVMKLYTSYANYMDSMSLKRPTELLKYTNIIDMKKIIYYLRNICIPDVLDSAYETFNSEEKVNEERLEICQHLRQIDPDNDNFYIDEISRITQNKRVLQNVQILDESKIDIDLLGIRNNKKDIFTQNFKRFIEIGNFDISLNVLDMSNSKVYLINYYSKEDHTAITEKKNQKYVLWKELFTDYRGEFAFGQYGLDSSLSTRIRHGRLENVIRGVFEQHHLVYVKADLKSDNYVPGEFIEEKLSTYGYLKMFNQLIHKIFADFSRFIDHTIENLNANVIRIKTENINPNGKFDFYFSEDQYLIMFSDTSTIKDDGLLIDYFENILMRRVENSLHNLQNLIKNELKQCFVTALNNLETNISKEFDKFNYLTCPDIKQNIINCRTVIQNELDKIAEWFKLPQKQEFSDFTFEQLLETCDAINKNLFPSFNEITIHTENTSYSSFKGFTFSYFVDIFVILFTNTIIHSGFINDIHDLKINLCVFEDDLSLFVEIQNNLSNEINSSIIYEKIKVSKERIEESKNNNLYHSYEGGSGYVKIYKILEYNIRSQFYLSFGLDEKDNYFFKVIIKKHDIISGGIDNESTVN